VQQERAAVPAERTAVARARGYEAPAAHLNGYAIDALPDAADIAGDLDPVDLRSEHMSGAL
jgi:hypothetical protein